MIKEFKIGGIKYTVVEKEQIQEGGKLLYGRHNPTESTVEIANRVSDMNVSDDMKKVTFFHEALHAMIFVSGLSFPDGDQEEEFVERMGFILKEFMEAYETSEKNDNSISNKESKK